MSRERNSGFFGTRTKKEESTEATAPAEQERTPREQRADTERPSDQWQPASVLPTPLEQDGYAFRWIRTSLFDRADVKNVSKKFREGWEPVKADDHPEIAAQSDIDSRFSDGIEIGGLLLCKAPIEKIRARREYYSDRAQDQMRAVDEGFMNDNDPRMRKFSDKKSRTEFGRG